MCSPHTGREGEWSARGTLRKGRGEGDQSAKFAWKKAFFGVLIQWMYRLSLEAGLKEQLNEVLAETIGKLQAEAGRTTDDIAHEALDTFYAYMTVSGYSAEDIQLAVADILA